MTPPSWASALFDRLQQVRETKPNREWTFLCVGHNDHKPSASASLISDAKYGERLVLCCHSQHCSQDAILSALGLDWRALVAPKSPAVAQQPDYSAAGSSGKRSPPAQGSSRLVAVYSYTDENGGLLFQALRYEPKRFSQRAPNGRSGWRYKLDGVRRVLYRLPELLVDIQAGKTICLVEGEKDVDNLRALGFAATCNSQGGGKWLPEYTEALRGAGVVIVPDNDKAGHEHRDTVGNAIQHAAARVGVLEMPGLPEKGDVSDWINGGGTAQELQRLIEEAPEWKAVEIPVDQQPAEQADAAQDRKSTTAERLVALAQAEAKLFMSERDEPFARVPVEGGQANLMLRSKAFREWLGYRFWKHQGRAPNNEALQTALGLLAGAARFESGQRSELSVRVACHEEGSHYVDLGGSSWNAVRITAQGWNVDDAPPCLFRRHTATAEQPVPKTGGDLEKLHGLLNLMDDAAWRMLVVWLASAFFPDIAHPVLHIQGEQGTAKSTAARMISDLVDPSRAPLRTEPRDSREWMQAADHSWMVTLDNVSKLPTWLSDALCRAVTGEADTRRQLFTDDDDVLIEFRRIICLTSIEEVIDKSDLRDRTLLLPLTPLSEETRRTEDAVWKEWAQVRPGVFGALLTLVSGVLRELPAVHLERLPRMADFARIGAAVEKVMGWDGGAFHDAYDDNQNAHHVAAVEADGIATLVLLFAQNVVNEAAENKRETPEWSGTPSELLDSLRTFETDRNTERNIKRKSCLPERANQMSGRLSRLAPNLRAVGVTLTSKRNNSARNLTLCYTPPEQKGKPSSPSSPSSPPSQNPVTMPEPPSSRDDQVTMLLEPSSPGFPSQSDGRDEGDDEIPLYSGEACARLPKGALEALRLEVSEAWNRFGEKHARPLLESILCRDVASVSETFATAGAEDLRRLLYYAQHGELAP